MMRFAPGRLVAAALLWVCSGQALAQIDPFYLDLEREAEIAAVRGDVAGAARLYRVACFGMLDEPARLAACTVRLATAQAAAKDSEGFRASYLRLATVEERFQGLTRADVSLEEKRELARVAATRLAPELLAQIPVLAELIAAEREDQAAKSASQVPKSKEKKRRGKAEPFPTPEIAAPVASAESVPPAEEAPRPEAVQADDLVPSEPALLGFAAAPAVATSPDQDRLDAARRRAAENPERSVVEAELDAVRAIADRRAGDVAAARLAGDLAYLLGLWPVCSDYYQRAGDPEPEQALGRFYMAVCLFETGQAESAARLLAPSAERLKRSPFVDGYLSRILGSSATP